MLFNWSSQALHIFSLTLTEKGYLCQFITSNYSFSFLLQPPIITSIGSHPELPLPLPLPPPSTQYPVRTFTTTTDHHHPLPQSPLFVLFGIPQHQPNWKQIQSHLLELPPLLSFGGTTTTKLGLLSHSVLATAFT